jgi:flagellar basal-body rod modification protein FlgD
MATTNSVGSIISAATAPITATATNKNILGKDDFLKLLLQQLKYQDPLNPMDGAQYAAQLAQFSSVEQLQNINTSLSSSIDANYVLAQSVNNTMAASLIGKDVKLSGNSFSYDGSTNVNAGYTLPGAVNSVSIDVYNDKNEKVRTITGTGLTAGDHQEVWDGKNDNGTAMASGKYTFKVNATDASGASVTATQFLWGKIDAVRFTTSGTVVVINNTEVGLSSILQVGGKGA